MNCRNEYLIVKCIGLADQWECDCDRTPLGIVTDYTPYQEIGFEIYAIGKNSGKCILIKEYDEIEMKGD